MKKLILLAVVAMMGLQSQAQIVGSDMSMTRTQVIETPKTGWTSFGFEYLPSNVVPDHGDSESFTGLGLVWAKASSLTSAIPLFLEAGVGAQYSTYSHDHIDAKMASVKVPINLIYDYQIPNTSINLDPYIGVRARLHVWGEAEIGDNDFNLFDEDDMGEDYTFNRFQIGFQLGVKARFNNSFYVGVGYCTDSEFHEEFKWNTSEVNLQLGFVF